MFSYSIADALATGAPIILAADMQPTDPILFDVRSAVTNILRISADEPASWYYLEQEQVSWGLGSPTYGPLRLPFQSVWIEWNAPSYMYAAGEMRVNPTLKGGAFVTSTPYASFDEAYGGRLRPEHLAGLHEQLDGSDHVLALESFFVPAVGAKRVIYVGAQFVGVREDGRFVGDAAGGSGHTYLYSSQRYRGVPQDVIHGLYENNRPALLAIGLMNCRNVTVADVALAPSKRAQKRRRHVPTLTFKTLKLPIARASSRSEKQSVTNDHLPFHMVRGHFKTFTQEAPLMGKAVGTYWWGWQSRGKKGNGIVKKDYEVER